MLSITILRIDTIMSHYKKFVKDIGVLGFVLAGSRIKGIILLAILTKSLGAESYGIWAQILVTLSLITPVAILGLPYALVRFLPDAKTFKETREHVWSTVLLILGSSLIVIIPLLFFPHIVSNLLQAPSNLIILLALLIVLESLSAVLVDAFRAFGEIGKYSLLTFGIAGGEIAFTAISISLGYGLWGAVFSLALIRGVVLLFALLMLLKKIGFEIPRFTHAKEYLKFGLPTIATNTAHWVVQVSDRYFIAWFLGILFVGYYAPAYTIGLIINLFILPVMLILQPAVSKLFSEGKIEEVKKYLSYSLKYILCITIPAAAGLIVLSKQILTIFSTHDIAIHASPVVPFVAASILLYGVYGVFAQVLLLFKKTSVEGTVWMASAIISLVLNILIIPPFGILGAAIATLAGYSTAFFLIIWYASRHLRFSVDWRFIGKSVSASLLMSSMLLLFPIEGLVKTIGAVVAGVLLYGIFMLLMNSFSQKEKELFFSFLKMR